MPLFLLAHWRALGALAIVVVLAGYIETIRLERDHYQSQRDQVRAEFATFKAETKALGEKAKADALAREAADKKRKEDADAENATTLAARDADIKRLRDQRDSARRGKLPPASTATGSVDQACFDRPALERAYGELVTGLRGLGDEGARAIVDLDTAKRWARP